MRKKKLDQETRRALMEARALIEGVVRSDGNEAETRRRVERIFGSVMGYNVFKHVSREYAVHGAGDTEHCDFAIVVDDAENAKPVIMLELKRVSIDLAPKHLRQAAGYAINIGCEWIVLTNGRDWRLFHVTYGKPPETKMVSQWNLLEDEMSDLAERFRTIGYKNVKRGGLDALWQKTNVLTPRNLLQTVFSTDSLRLLRREIRKMTDVLVTPEEIVHAFRRILNQSAADELETLKISIPSRTRRRRKKAGTGLAPGEESGKTDNAPEQNGVDPAVT